MRKFLLASVATLGTGGLVGSAMAQVPAVVGTPVVGAPTQGQTAYPAAGVPNAFVNNNNNYQAPALPGALANPTPGTIVIHVNGKVQVDFQTTWGSLDNHLVTATAAQAARIGNATTAPAGSPGAPTLGVSTAGVVTPTPLGTVLGQNGIGDVKVMPQAIDSFARIYMGGDAMATNGLRYGAAFEIRQNFTGQISSNASSGASGYSSLETLFVRRAFTYVAGEQWGIVRIGQADGLISIFDNGVTTFQFTPTGNLNGGDLTNIVGGPIGAFVFLAQAGNEYDNAKAVYLSPQIAGFDFGIQYAPNTSNGNGISSANIAPLVGSLNGSGTGTGNSCAIANTGCPTLSSGPGIQDGSRSINQAAIGARYQGQFGATGLLAYVVGEGSQHATYTGQTTAAVLGNTAVPTSKFNGSFNDLAIGSAGVAATFAGFTVGGNVVGGQMNGQLGLQPKGGAPLVGFLLGAKYVAGPLTVGVVGEEYWEQGNVNLSGISQLRARTIDFAGSYTVAPGFTVFAEYLWGDQYQGARNFVTGAIGSAAGAGAFNNIKGQGFLVGNVVNF
jgi:Gram-negative porin